MAEDKKYLDSFDLQGTPHVSSVHPITTLGIKIQPPADWLYWPRYLGNPNVDMYFPIPRWIKIAFELTVEVLGSPSYGTAHADYAAYVQWDKATNHWTQDLYQMSLRQPQLPPEMKVLQKSKVIFPDFINVPLGSPGSHVDIPLDLSNIGYPTNYVVDSTVVLIFLTTGVKVGCLLKEVTPWVPLPPPKISLYTIPNSQTLGPGIDTTIEVHANSSMTFPSVVSLSANAPSELSWYFSPRAIDLSSSSPVGTSTLHMKASPKLINSSGATEFPLPIIGSVSFPIRTIDTATGTYVNNTSIQKIPVIAYPEIIVKNGPSWTDEIGSWFQFIRSNLTEVQALVAAVAAIVTPITTIVILVRRTKKKGQVTTGREEKEGSL